MKSGCPTSACHSKNQICPSLGSLDIDAWRVLTSVTAKSLGVVFDEHMPFDAYIRGTHMCTCKSSFYQLKNL